MPYGHIQNLSYDIYDLASDLAILAGRFAGGGDPSRVSLRTLVDLRNRQSVPAGQLLHSCTYGP